MLLSFETVKDVTVVRKALAELLMRLLPPCSLSYVYSTVRGLIANR